MLDVPENRDLNTWSGKCSSGSGEPPLRQSLGFLSDSPSHQWSLLEENHFIIVEMYRTRAFSQRRKIKLTYSYKKVKNN